MSGMKKTKGSKMKDIETGKIVADVSVKDILGKSQGWFKLALFLAGIPISIIVLIVYAISFIFPYGVAVPIGVTVGLLLISFYMDKLMVIFK